MTKTLFILGRQPIFGIAEIESLFPDTSITKINENIISLDKDVDVKLMDRLGGTIKIAKEIVTIETLKNRSLSQLINEEIVNNLLALPDGKINFGISYYGNKQTVRDIEKIALGTKKLVRQTGRSFRIVPNNGLELSSAQVFHNKLTNKTGFELIIIDTGSTITLARSIAVQNIQSYGSRDQKRPYRDAKIGMLPPKLAQIMINLVDPSLDSVILDPFCGTGVILQEALLMNLKVIGTDIDQRMVDYSSDNIKWLRQKYPRLRDSKISNADATTNQWQEKIDYVVTETYLGRPFFQTPRSNLIDKEQAQVNELLIKFLKNIYSQLNSDTKLCIAIPAWRYNDQFIHLPLLDQLAEIGYNPMSFKNLEAKNLIYYRPNQVVARQILLLTRK